MKQLPKKQFGILLASTLLLSCSERDEDVITPAFAFKIGSHTLFALDANNEPINIPTPQETISEKPFPKITVNVENRVVAELGVSDGTVLPLVTTSPFYADSQCSLGTTLQKTQDTLSRIALTKDIYSQVDAHFSTLSSCKTKDVLECFLNRVNARDWNDLPTAALRGLTLKGIVSRLGECTGSESHWQTKSHFNIANSTLYFYPSPVVAIYIYAGSHKSYTTAVATSDSHMKAVNLPCQEFCFDTGSPSSILLPSIPGNSLESGKTYTAFLQTMASQAEKSMVPVIFTAP
jgi:hypothetical protein